MSQDAEDTKPKTPVDNQGATTTSSTGGLSRKTWLVILAVVVVVAVAVGVAVPLATRDSSSGSDDMGGNDSNQTPSTGPANPVKWLQKGETIEGHTLKDRFGWSVAASASGLVVAVGAISIDADGSFRQVQVYEYKNNEWAQLGQSLESENLTDYFGWDVALSSDGTTLAVGTRRGAYVRVYRLSDENTWAQLGSDVTGLQGGCFGCAVALSQDGDLLAVGAKDANSTNFVASGVVQTFSYNGAWSQSGPTLEGDGTNQDFGASVALTPAGSRLAVGAPNADYVRVFDYKNSQDWDPVVILEGETVGDKFGYKVAMSTSGETIAISAHRNSEIGYGAGHVRVFQNVGDFAIWQQVGEDIDGDNDGQFGFSLALSGDGSRVAAGANLDNGNGKGFATGSVRIFDYNGMSWVQAGDELIGQDNQDEFGQSVAMSEDGKIVVVGTKFGVGGEEQERTGHVKVFQDS